MDKGKARAVPLDPDREADSPLSYNQLVSGIIDFLEVAFHTILCLRAVYPFEVFARRKKYSHVCYQSRHPGLTEYVSRVLVAIRREIERSKVSKVILVIRPNLVQASAGTYASDKSTDQDTELPPAYERFVFALDYLVPSLQIDQRNRDLAISDNVTSAELELIFRGFLQKIMAVDGILYDIPSPSENDGVDSEEGELTFAIVLEMNDDADAPQGAGSEEPETGDWILADTENLGRLHGSSPMRRDASEDVTRPKIRPIKSLDSGVINLMLFVEEDLHVKSRDLPSARKANQKTGGLSTASKLEDNLLLARATQGGGAGATTSKARELKNRAKRLDAERDLDQFALPEDADADLLNIGSHKKKRRATNARMVLGETRAAETDSDSESDNERSDLGSSQSVRDGGGGSDMDVF